MHPDPVEIPDETEIEVVARDQNRVIVDVDIQTLFSLVSNRGLRDKHAYADYSRGEVIDVSDRMKRLNAIDDLVDVAEDVVKMEDADSE